MAVDAEALARLNADVFYAMPSDSRTAIVAFGAKGGGKRHFHFFKLLQPLPGLTKLLVRDPSDSWYNAGLPGAGETVGEIAGTLEGALADLGATRVVTCGSSMGGYAALLFGCMIGAERAIAIGPQTLLDPVLPHAPLANVELQVADLEPVVRDASGTAIELVVGWDSLLDIFHARRVAEHPSVRVLAMPKGHHLFLNDLNREGKLVPLITELVDGGTPDLCHVDPPLDTEAERRIGDAVFAAHRRQWRLAAESIGPVAEQHPRWAGPNLHYGWALAKMGESAGAELALTRAITANPQWVLPREHLAEVYLEQGRAEEAEPIVREGLASNPDWWFGYLCLGECLRQLGRADEALAMAGRVESGVGAGLVKDPTWARGHLAMAGALRLLGRKEAAQKAAQQAMKLNPRLAERAEKALVG